MASEFQANTVLFGDEAGWGIWQSGHARQHLRYLSALAALATPIIIPDVPLFNVGSTPNEIQTWFHDHYFAVHVPLRDFTGITGPDFSVVDIGNQEFFYDFLDLHNSEHLLLDIAFGVA